MPTFPSVYGLFDGRSLTGVLDVNESGVKFTTSSKTYDASKDSISEISYFENIHGIALTLHRDEDVFRFVGLSDNLMADIKRALSVLGKTILEKKLSIQGHSWGNIEIQNNNLAFELNEKLVFDIPLSSMTQSVVHNKHEVGMEIRGSDKARDDAEELVEIRFYIPNSEDSVNDDEVGEVSAAAMFNERLQSLNNGSEASVPLTTLKDLPMVLPRGKYTIQLYDTHLRMSNKTFNYSIKYSNITRLFSFEKPDNQTLFILGLDPPIRQGSTSYPFLMFQCDNMDQAPEPIMLNLTEDEVKTRFGGKLDVPVLTTGYQESLPWLFHLLTNLRVVRPANDYLGTSNLPCVRATCKANDGYLFMLAKGMFFVKKPAMHIRFEDIQTVLFDRLPGSGSLGSDTKSFDLKVYLVNVQNPIEFVSIHTGEFDNMFKFLLSKNVNIERVNDVRKLVGRVDSHMASRSINMNDDDDDIMPGLPSKYQLAENDDDDDEDDEEYSAAESESSDDYNTDDENAGEGRDADAGEDDDDENNEDEEKQKDTSSKPKKEKKEKTDKATEKAPKKERSKKSEKAATDKSSEKGTEKKQKKKKEPGQPKAPSTAYIQFSNAKRNEVKESRPDIAKNIGAIAKVLGEMWSATSVEDKAPYNKLAEEDKQRYEREMTEWKAKKAASGDVVEEQPPKKKAKKE